MKIVHLDADNWIKDHPSGTLYFQHLPAPGGVLVRDSEGAVLAAVGVSGDNPANDEACAVFAIEHGGFVADPGETP